MGENNKQQGFFCWPKNKSMYFLLWSLDTYVLYVLTRIRFIIYYLCFSTLWAILISLKSFQETFSTILISFNLEKNQAQKTQIEMYNGL